MSEKSITFAPQIKIYTIMKKLFNLLAVVAVVLGMASCGDGNTPSDPKPVYTVYDKTTHVMTYYCDDRMESRTGDNFIVEEYSPNMDFHENRLEAYGYYPNVLKVVIDASMKDYPYTSMQNIFGSCYIPESNDERVGLKSMTMIEGLENLPTAKVTDMSYMFYLCRALTSLDLRSFNTANVKDMSHTFAGCTSLTTIYCNDDWSQSASNIDSDRMFYNCSSLKGGNRTGYDANHGDISYAHPDGGKNNPGYFTLKADYNGVNGWRYYDNNTPFYPFGPNNNTLF